LIQANALALPLENDSVDLIITSPPYFGLRNYLDEDAQIGQEPHYKDFLDNLVAATAEMKRVLKESGSIWVNLGDKYANTGGHNNSNIGADAKRGPSRYAKTPEMPSKTLMGLPWRYALRCMDELGLILRAEVIWNKPNGMPESVRDRVRRSHEQWFHFTLAPRYFAEGLDDLREPHSTPAKGLTWDERKAKGFKGATRGASVHLQPATDGNYARHPKGKLPGSVWTIPTEPLRVPQATKDALELPTHFAAFPQEWPRRIISAFSAPGAVVLDPFCGSGTVPMVASALGRKGVGVDLAADYLRLADWRCHASGHWAKTLERIERG